MNGAWDQFFMLSAKHLIKIILIWAVIYQIFQYVLFLYVNLKALLLTRLLRIHFSFYETVLIITFNSLLSLSKFYDKLLFFYSSWPKPMCLSFFYFGVTWVLVKLTVLNSVSIISTSHNFKKVVKLCWNCFF